MHFMGHEFDKSVGAAIRRARVMRGLTQQQLAKLLEVSFQQLQKYELGTNRINFERLCQLSRIFELPVESWAQEAGHAPPDDMEQHRQMLGLMHSYQKIADGDKRTLLCAVARAFSNE